MRKVGQKIKEELLSWEGVKAKAHRFGATAFYLGNREIGHVHGDRWVDIPFPTKVHEKLKLEGMVETHPHAPDSGWSRLRLRS